MTGGWLRSGVVVGLALIVANALAMLASQARPPRAGLADASCALPCWANIHPGSTPAGDAVVELAQRGYTLRAARDSPYLLYAGPETACTARLEFRGTVVHTIRLRCDDLRLGDLVIGLGAPDSIAPGATVARFDFGRIRARFNAPACVGRLTPFTPVTLVSLSGRSDVPTGASRWHGFQPLWRYRRLAPPTSGC